MAAIHAKIYQFATHTYHLLIAIEMTLLDQSVHTSWPTVRDTLKSDQICIVVLPTDDGSALRIRKAATPEPDVENLYRTLGIASQIIKPQHSWTPSDSDLQKGPSI